MTSTWAKLVCRRWAESKGESRTRRCTPFSACQHAVGVLAPHGEGGRLEARLVARGRLEDLEAVAARSAQRGVGAQQHLGPVLGVGPAGAGRQGADRVAGVVLAGEQRLLLQPVDLAPDAGLALGHLGQEARLVGHQLDEPREVVDLALEGAVGLEPPADAGVLRRQPPGGARVVPHAGRGQGLVQLGVTAFERSRVKGNHGPAPGGPEARLRPPRARSRCRLARPWRYAAFPWQRLYLWPEPHGHGSLRPDRRLGAVLLHRPRSASRTRPSAPR